VKVKWIGGSFKDQFRPGGLLYFGLFEKILIAAIVIVLLVTLGHKL
jgi:hypothetical protein